MVVQRKSLIGRPKERKKVYKVGSYIPFVGLRFLIHCNFISTEESKNRIPFGYVWFPKSTKERKKMLRKMIFSCLVVL